MASRDDELHGLSLLVLFVAVPVALANELGPAFPALCLPVLWVSVLAHELGHLAAALAAGSSDIALRLGTGPRLARFRAGGVDVTVRLFLGSGRVTHTVRAGTSWRALAAFLAAGPAVSLLLALAGTALPPPAGTAVVVANAVAFVASTVLAPEWGDGPQVLRWIGVGRADARLRPLADRLAALREERRFGEAADLLAPVARRVPANARLSTLLAADLCRAGRNDEAIRAARRLARRSLRPGARRSARRIWADLVLSFPTAAPRSVRRAARVARTQRGSGSLARYLRALAALRAGDATRALARAGEALDATPEDPENAHAVACMHGVRALALHRLGRDAEAAAAVAAGRAVHASCDLPDLLEEAEAALAR